MTAADLPLVSILVPYHNCKIMTETCLRSLVACTRECRWELILMDDASTEQPDLETIMAGQTYTRLRNESRCSFSENNNRMAAAASGEYLCLLNNDTRLSPGWLSSLLQVCARRPKLGVLGNLHLYPHSGRVQHSGMGFDENDMPLHLNPGADPRLPSVNWEREFQAVTFACVMIPRSVYGELNGLETAYRNGFEDVDFCLRARAAGYEVLYTPGSRIEHFGQSTPGRTDHDNANWLEFRSRWGGKVKQDLKALADEDLALNKAHDLLPGPGVHVDIDLGAPNAFLWGTVELIKALRRRGVPVSVPRQPGTHPSVEGADKKLLQSCMRLEPLMACHIKWTHYWPQYLRAPLFGDINAEFFCTNYRYRRDKRRLDLWMRHVQVNEYRKLPVAPFNLDALGDLPVPEADCSVMNLGYSPEVETLYPDEASLPAKTGGPFRLLLVTNSHDLNRYGTDLAIQALGQAFTSEDPIEVHLKDYGAGAETDTLDRWIAAFPRFPKIVWHRDFISKAELIRLYAGMDAQLAPYRGEGFSMKILDAAAVGVPTLMPLYGGPTAYNDEQTCFPLPFSEVPVGHCLDQDNFHLGEGAVWCEPHVPEMVEILKRLPGQRDLCRDRGLAAFRKVRGAFSWDQSAEALMTALDTWSSQRRAAIAPRMGPDRLAISVVIPTKDRPDALALTLKAYTGQTFPLSDVEILLVNDHGDRETLDQVCAAFPNLPLKVMDNPGPGGPGAARNFAIEQAVGHIVLITGDDIVPAPDFLKSHVEGHRKHPEKTSAFVGRTLWHPDLPQTPFMRYIDGEGGQQFKYNDLKDGGRVPFDRLYTSNCSLKRRFLAEQERLFSPWYRFAAFEDVELGYRLHLRKMTLRYLEHANGYHYHLMTPESFVQRQRRVGRMLTMMALQRPDYVPNEHTTYLQGLELLRARKELLPVRDAEALSPDGVLNSLLTAYTALLDQGEALGHVSDDRARVRTDAQAWSGWMAGGSRQVWESVNQMALRFGMAEEWLEDEADPRAVSWTYLLMLPNIVQFQGVSWDMPFVRHAVTQSIAPNSRLVYNLAKSVRNFPGLGGWVVRFEHSPRGKYVRDLIARTLARLSKQS